MSEPNGRGGPATIGSYNQRQRLTVRYSFAVLVDLTVLNLFAEYWDYVYLDGFTVSLLAAMLLQILLVVTVKIEHGVARRIAARSSGTSAKVKRFFATWGILFGSKLMILEAINLAFGEQVRFTGPWHGVVAFIVVVIAIISAEEAFRALYRSLGVKDDIEDEGAVPEAPGQ